MLLNSLKPAFDLIKQLINTLATVFKSVASVITSILNVAFKSFGELLTPLIKLITDLVSWLGDKLKPVIELVTSALKLLSADFKLLNTTVSNVASVGFKQIKDAMQDSIGKIKDLINWVKELFAKFADSSFGQVFLNIFNQIGNAINWVKGLIQGLTNDINNSINKTNTLISAQDNASRYARSQARGAVFDDALMRSGGLGVTANIHVENNGTPIDTAEIRRWAEVIASEVDKQLGHAF